ncbi:Fic family protein [Euzebya sp.]|uniref:Fic family protein n=1 Tax=Euzebya sp. TaxID=1971409 RepID=UPI0035125129
MDIERFKNSPIGQLVPVHVHDRRDDQYYDHFAYVPHPLPATIPLSQATFTAINEATLALGRLDGMARLLPNPLLLVRPVIRREAVSTSALEGTYAGVQDVFEADLLSDEALAGDVREVRNYVRATEHALDLIRERPIGINLLSQLQKMLVAGTRGDSYQAGAPRREQVWIDPKEARIHQSRFVPPPPGEPLEQGIRDWERWIHGQLSPTEDHDIPLLVRVIVGHYQFETLHPFHDGNGRIGRLLIALHLLAEGVLQVPILYISPYLEPRRDEYTDHLRRVSETGDFEPWIEFFAEVLTKSADDALGRIKALLDTRERIVHELRDQNVRGTAVQIAESLIGYPVVSPTQAAGQHGVAYPTANNAIKRLVDAGVLTELTGRNYGRVFACIPVLRIIE